MPLNPGTGAITSTLRSKTKAMDKTIPIETTHSKAELVQHCSQIIESLYFNTLTGLDNLSSEQLGDIKSRVSKIEAIIERFKDER